MECIIIFLLNVPLTCSKPTLKGEITIGGFVRLHLARYMYNYTYNYMYACGSYKCPKFQCPKCPKSFQISNFRVDYNIHICKWRVVSYQFTIVTRSDGCI